MGKEARRKRDKRKKSDKAKAKAKAAEVSRVMPWGDKVTRRADGSKTVKFGPETAAALRAQLAAFEQRFGRPPGPDDPLFFDEDLDVPTPLTAAKSEAIMVDAMRAAEVDPAMIYAHQQTGLFLTPDNVDLVSDDDRDEWTEAVERYRRTHEGRPAFDPDDVAKIAGQYTAWLVGLVVADEGEMFFTEIDQIPTEADDGLFASLMVANLFGWLVRIRDDTDLVDELLDAAIDRACSMTPGALADTINAASGLVRRGRGQGGTVNDLFEQAGDDRVLLVALMTLLAAVVVETGHTTVAAMLDDLGLPFDINPGQDDAGR